MNEVRYPLRAFAGYGIELEYMIVDRHSLSVMPIADQVLHRLAGGDYVCEFTRDGLCWSNELALHVLELNNATPRSDLAAIADGFTGEIERMNGLLQGFGARLMPTAMHPWMDPRKETHLWSRGNSEIYCAYQRIFDCAQHGLANLQSAQVNLPFGDDGEFARLHAAIRIVLPLLPALAASSPIVEGKPNGCLDVRLNNYGSEGRRIAQISGKIIPEKATCRGDYETNLLQPMYAAISPYDPAGVLQHEWLNARGAAPRFERGALEIRLIDIQECVSADIAIAAVVIAVVKALYDGRWSRLAAQQDADTDLLADLLSVCSRDADLAAIEQPAYLQLFGLPGGPRSAGELWRHLIDNTWGSDPAHERLDSSPLDAYLHHGPLARRILNALGTAWNRTRLHAVYGELCDCLAQNRVFTGLPH